MCKKRIDGVYLIKNNMTLRVRVGSAKDVYKRWSNYLSKLRNGTANKMMQKDYNDYGEESFEIIILEECNVGELFKREQHYQMIYEDVAKYNVNKIANTDKKIRRGYEAKNYKEKRSKITSGESNGHCTKLDVQSIFSILDMVQDGVDKKIIATKYDIQPSYISRFGKDRWVKEYREWMQENSRCC